MSEHRLCEDVQCPTCFGVALPLRRELIYQRREAERRGFMRAVGMLRSDEAQSYFVKMEDYLDNTLIADWLEARKP